MSHDTKHQAAKMLSMGVCGGWKALLNSVLCKLPVLHSVDQVSLPVSHIAGTTTC